MTKRLEIVRALRGYRVVRNAAAIQTFLDDRLTAVSESMPLIEAREKAAASGLPVIDHLSHIQSDPNKEYPNG